MADTFVMAICNRKGGSGKTTTAVNLAAEYAARGHRTLLIDLDTQGHAGLGLGIAAPRGGASAHRIFLDPDFKLSSAICPTTQDHLWLAPADDMFDPSHGGNGAALKMHLASPEIAERFDLVVIDTAPSLDLTLMAALGAAHAVVAPLLLHPLSLEGVRQLVRLVWKTATMDNPRLTLVGLLPVMANLRINLQKSVQTGIISQFGIDKVLGGIRADITLAEAFAARQPIQVFAPRCRGALDYHLLANELSALWRWETAAGRPDLGAA